MNNNSDKHPHNTDGLCYSMVRKRRRTIPVTVCVAARCAEGVIFGASDRMLTSGDIEFEPQQPKLYPVSNSIVIQIAGDASVQAQIIQPLHYEVGLLIRANPAEWVKVEAVAELYQKFYDKLRLACAEHDILTPLYLDRNSWLTKQNEMESGLVKDITGRLMNYNFAPIGAIISGVDTSGAHIYVFQDGAISCQDAVGFAAIGIGEWHASSQLMFARHSPLKSIPETLLSVYIAKKRAEVAPGVGADTDMFAVGPRPGSYVVITPNILNGLEKIYQKELAEQGRIQSSANSEIRQFVTELAQQMQGTQATKPKEDSN